MEIQRGIDWCDRPDEQASERKWTVKRCGAKGSIRFLCVVRRQAGLYTHFWGGRTVPHIGQNCRACDDGSAKEWSGFLCGVQSNTLNHLILPYTAAIGAVVAGVEDVAGDLRGLTMEIRRKTEKVNGPLHIIIGEKRHEAIDTFPEPDLRFLLARMWRTTIEQAERILEPHQIRFPDAVPEEIAGTTLDDVENPQASVVKKERRKRS